MDRRTFALLAAALAVSGGAARAADRLEAMETVKIAAPAEKVWARIGDFQDLSWHPAVARTEGAGENTAGTATRHLVLQGDGTATIDEALDAHDAGAMSYGYRITKVDPKVLPVANYASTLTVKTVDAAKSLVEWHGVFDAGNPEVSPEDSVKAISGVYRGGLDALKKALEGG